MTCLHIALPKRLFWPLGTAEGDPGLTMRAASHVVKRQPRLPSFVGCYVVEICVSMCVHRPGSCAPQGLRIRSATAVPATAGSLLTHGNQKGFPLNTREQKGAGSCIVRPRLCRPPSSSDGPSAVPAAPVASRAFANRRARSLAIVVRAVAGLAQGTRRDPAEARHSRRRASGIRAAKAR